MTTNSFEAIGIAEESLFSMIELRLDQLKKQIKKSPRDIAIPNDISSVLADHNDKIIDKAVKTIIKLESTEEVYLFIKQPMETISPIFFL